MNDSDAEGLLAQVERAQRHPVEWLDQAMGLRFTDMQQDILNALVDEPVVAVKSSHAQGKSYLAAGAVIWFSSCHGPSKVITTAPTHRQVETILWSEIGGMRRKAKRALGGKLMSTEIKVTPDWFAMGFTAPDYDPTRFQGFHSPHILVVVDEASGITPAIFEGISALLTGEHSRLLLIGNPTDGSSAFARYFKRASVKKFTLSAFDNVNFTKFGITIEDIRANTWKEKITGPLPFPSLITPAAVRGFWEDWGEDTPMWEARVLAMFPTKGDEGLIPGAWVEAANSRWERLQEEGWSGLSRLGLDVARYGADDSVIAEWVGNHGIRALFRSRKQDTVETSGWTTVTMRDTEAIEVRVDADGLGAGVFDMLRVVHGDAVVEMRSGMQARDPAKFLNRRAEWFWNLREMLDPKGPNPIALPVDDNLMSQLTAMRWKLTQRGLIQMESKDDMRARGMKSPDEADAVAFAAANMQAREQEIVIVDPMAGYSANQWRI